MNRRATGAYYEKIALEYLIKNNLEIITTNYRSKRSEIDIIAKDKDCLVFVEVKYRTDTRYGTALDAVNTSKQLKIRQGAVSFFNEQRLYDVQCRFDVIAITGKDIVWIKDAF